MIEREDPTSTREMSEFEISEEMSDLFAQLDPGHVEQFYKHYQIWSKQRRLALVQLQTSALQEAINDNTELLQQIRPSAIALAALSQLQSCGVDDIDLLDRMLERGDVWLDQTMQLLVQCERMGFIQDGYTLWCENALDGAFDWIISMNEATIADTPDVASPLELPLTSAEPLKEVTEDLLLQKLMSEDEEDTKKRPAITAPLGTTKTEEDAFSSLTVVPQLAPLKDFFSSLSIVPLPAHEKDFFSSLAVVPQPAQRSEMLLTEIDEDISKPAEIVIGGIASPSQEEPSQELFVIASMHATPLPAPSTETVETPVSLTESPVEFDNLTATEQEVTSKASTTSNDEVITTDIEPHDEESGITASIPRMGIGARIAPEPAEQRTDVLEKIPAPEIVPIAAVSNDVDEAVHSDTSPWKWKELTQHEISVAHTDVLTSVQQEKHDVAAKTRRKVGFFRRLLNWLLGRTPDY